MKKLTLFLIFLLLPLFVYAQQKHRGVVLETFNVEGYTYMQIKDEKEVKWIASPLLEVKKGDIVETSFGMLMPDFESKTLNRTFKEIYFVTYAKVVTPSEKNKGDQKRLTKDAKADNVLTLRDIVEKKDKYAGKIVVFNAKVTKYSPKIMGLNWLHVTEPSSNGDGTLDIVVTTEDETKIGEIVKIMGRLTTNKNIGAGYFFPLLVEEASILPADKVK